MFIELRVMQRELGSKLDTLTEATEERRVLGLRYSALALGARLMAKNIEDGGESFQQEGRAWSCSAEGEGLADGERQCHALQNRDRGPQKQKCPHEK